MIGLKRNPYRYVMLVYLLVSGVYDINNNNNNDDDDNNNKSKSNDDNNNTNGFLSWLPSFLPSFVALIIQYILERKPANTEKTLGEFLEFINLKKLSNLLLSMVSTHLWIGLRAHVICLLCSSLPSFLPLPVLSMYDSVSPPPLFFF